MKACFITWYPSCRRSDAIAAALGGSSYLIHYLGFKRPILAPFKYVLQSFRTWSILWNQKPDYVLVASPPIFAVIAVWLYCKLTRSSYVIDAHTGVFDDPRWTWLTGLSQFLSKRALCTIVTGAHTEEIVQSWGGSTEIISTVPVLMNDIVLLDLDSGPHIVVVNTFSQDEPIDEVLARRNSFPPPIFI